MFWFKEKNACLILENGLYLPKGCYNLHVSMDLFVLFFNKKITSEEILQNVSIMN